MEFFRHDIGEEEIEAVANAIRSGHITTGVKLKEFKDALKEKFRFPAVELCSSGTSALHLTLHALGVGPGDEVITTPFVGVWTPNTILMVGATPVFADIDPHTYNLSPESVRKALTPRTRVVMPVSVNGSPCDLQGLREVLPDHVKIVCDDIEALGSTRYGKYVGEDIGKDISVGGFWVSKQVTTGGGGMVVSEDEEFMYTFEKLTRHGHGLVGNMWEQSFGFNAWMNDFQAAMGIVQIERFEEKQLRLLHVKMMLDQFFGKDRKQTLKPGHTSTEFVYIIELPEGMDKRWYAVEMERCKVPTRPYFNNLMEVPHLAKYWRDLPNVATVSKKTIALPFHWLLTWEQVVKIAYVHRQVCGINVVESLGSK